MDKKKSTDVIVIGAGPAGLMAAGQAALGGANSLILEKTDAAGKKLSITGKKRCNLTNSNELELFIDHFGPNGRFLHQAFHQFFREELIDFFGKLGIQTNTERGGRIFPSNCSAADVTSILAEWVHRTGAHLKLLSPVKRIITEKKKITAVEIRNGMKIPSESVILCTGGATFIGTGSTGDGYRMAVEIGHSIAPIRPALVPLKTSGSIAQQLQGLSLRNISMQVLINGKKKSKAIGELLFTHFGISGPIVLTHSGAIVDSIRAGKKVSVSIDLKPALDEKKLDQRLLRELDAGGKQYFHTMLKRLIPQRMIPICTEQCEIQPDKPCHQVSSVERRSLLSWLKDLRLEITAPLSLETGMVTMGGISLEEVNPRTMMSEIIEGLFFAGEVLDLAGDTGGYNLQAAFSTGWLAGKQAAAYSQSKK